MLSSAFASTDMKKGVETVEKAEISLLTKVEIFYGLKEL